jgi:putative membrane protein
MIASFLGTKASFSADFSLVVMIVAAILLTIGWRLAVARRYEAHRWVQTGAVILNAIPVAFWMIRSFFKYIAPDLPGALDKGSYLLTTIHAVVGAIGVVVGVYIVIRANRFEVQGRDIAPLKTTMRVSYLIYMLAVLVGVAVYVVTYR